jgi:hypothetical protein
MASAFRVAESVSEALYEDERLRSNLTDEQANLVLKWASNWLTEQISKARDEAAAQKIAQVESARVRSALAALNALSKKSGDITLCDGITALEPVLCGDRAFNREEVLTLLTALTSAAWQLSRS